MQAVTNAANPSAVLLHNAQLPFKAIYFRFLLVPQARAQRLAISSKLSGVPKLDLWYAVTRLRLISCDLISSIKVDN